MPLHFLTKLKGIVMRIALLAIEEPEDTAENLETEQTIERPEVGNLNVDKVIEESKQINNTEEVQEGEKNVEA